jgi:hypothetical protein
LGALTTGKYNTAIGQAAGSSGVITGAGNLLVGNGVANSLTSGSYNIYIGGADGDAVLGTGKDLATGNANILIGRVDVPAGNTSNSIVIAPRNGGDFWLGDGSDTVVLGNSSMTSTRIAGTATSKLTVDGDTMRIVGTRNPASNAAGTAGDFAFGTTGGNTYLYYCIASGNWGRVQLTTGY